MPRTAEWERQCYGCDKETFLKSVDESLGVKLARPEDPSGGIGMVVMSLLSDAQEEVERGMSEEARQTINRAKLLIIERWMGQKS